MLPSQSQTLAPLVATAIGLRRPNLATIGRRMPGPATAQAAIERAWRSTRSGRVEVVDALAGMVRRLTRERKQRRLVSFDRVEVRDFPVPMAAAGSGGRAVPWLWASYPEWKLLRGQNRPEQGRRRPLKALLPRGARVVILADRGFGRAERAAVGQGLGFDSLVRIRPDVTGSSKRYRGGARLGSTPCPRGSPAWCGTSAPARTGGCGITSSSAGGRGCPGSGTGRGS